MIRLKEETDQDFLKRLELENAGNPGWAKPYVFRYILPGLCNYDDMGVGNLNVTKVALDKMQNSIIGKPIVNEGHRAVSPEDYKNGKADGIVTGTWYNVDDGWYWAEALIWDKETMRNCDSGRYFVSCAYSNIYVDKTPGVQGDIAYNQSLESADYTHVAVLTNPRYRGAVIMKKENYRGAVMIKNEKGGNTMKLTFLERVKKMVSGKEEEVVNSSEVEAENLAFTMGDGTQVPASRLLEVYNAATAPKKIEVVNGAVAGIDDNTLVKIGEKEVKFGDLKVIYAEHKNAADDEDKKKKEKEDAENAAKEAMNAEHKNGSHKTKLENCAMCNAAADDEDEDEDEDKKKKEAENKAHFKKLQEAANSGAKIEKPVIISKEEKLEKGRKLFGSDKK